MDPLDTPAEHGANDNPLPRSVPTLIIGLGGTGQRVLWRLRKRLWETHGRPRLDHIRFLLLDLDEWDTPPNESREGFPDCKLQSDLGEFIRCDITPDTFHKITAEQWKNPNRRWDWIDPSLREVSPHRFDCGSGVNRQVGRLAFMLHYPAIRSQLEHFIRELHHHATRNPGSVDATRMRFELIISLAGGAGSGMFIDCAYVLRDIFHSDPVLSNAIEHRISTVTAIMPTCFERLALPLANRFRQNAFAALRELQYYGSDGWKDDPFAKARGQAGNQIADPREVHDSTDSSVCFHAPWADRPIRTTGWDACQLIDDASNCRPGTHLELPEVCQMIADYQFWKLDGSEFANAQRRTAGDFQVLRDRVLGIDVRDGNGKSLFRQQQPCLYSSYGVAEIRINRQRICHAASYRLAWRLVQRLWLGNQNAIDESTYRRMVERDLCESGTDPQFPHGFSLNPPRLWRSLLESEVRDWYRDAEIEFDTAVAELPDENSASRLEALMGRHDHCLQLDGDARTTIRLRAAELRGTLAKRGPCHRWIDQAALTRFNDMGVDTTLRLLVEYQRFLEQVRQWAVDQAQRSVPNRMTILATLRDAADVPSFPFNARCRALRHIYPRTVEAARSWTLARYQTEACHALEGLAKALLDYVGRSEVNPVPAVLHTLSDDYLAIKSVLQEAEGLLTARFRDARKDRGTPRQTWLMPEWSDQQYDSVIHRALQKVGNPRANDEVDWMAVEQTILDSMQLPRCEGDRSRYAVLRQWRQSQGANHLPELIEELVQACRGLLTSTLEPEDVQPANVLDHLLEAWNRDDFLRNLATYSCPRIMTRPSSELEQAVPPLRRGLVGWVASDQVRRSGQDRLLFEALSSEVIHSFPSQRQSIELGNPCQAHPQTIVLIREMGMLPLGFLSQLPLLKRAYDDPALGRFRRSSHLDSGMRDLPEINLLTAEEHEQIRHGALNVLRAIALGWIKFEDQDFVVDVPHPLVGQTRWWLGTRINSITRTACVNDHIRNHLQSTWNQWRRTATPSQLAILHVALQLTAVTVTRSGWRIGTNHDDQHPFYNCLVNVLNGVRDDLLEKGGEAEFWSDLFTPRNPRDHEDYEQWKTASVAISDFIQTTCLHPASESLPMWQVDREKVSHITMVAVRQLVPGWQPMSPGTT